MAMWAGPACLGPACIRPASCGSDRPAPHIIRGLEHTTRPADILARGPAGWPTYIG